MLKNSPISISMVVMLSYMLVFPAHFMAGPTIDLILSGKWDLESLAKKQAALRVRISGAATGISSFSIAFHLGGVEAKCV
jgi:hypothetical protein